MKLQHLNTPSPISPSLALKPAANTATFGMSIRDFFTKKNPVSTDGTPQAISPRDQWLQLNASIKREVEQTPELQDLERRDTTFSSGLHNIEQATRTDSPEEQKYHLSLAQRLFNTVANNSEHPMLGRLESSALSMELKRQLGAPAHELKAEADRTEEMIEKTRDEMPSLGRTLKWMLGLGGHDHYLRSCKLGEIRDHVIDVRASYLPEDQGRILKQNRQRDKDDAQEAIDREYENMQSIREDRTDHWYNDIN